MERKLKRLPDQKIILGICAGFADYFSCDKTLVRLICVFALLLTGIFPVGILYLIAYFIMPADKNNNFIK